MTHLPCFPFSSFRELLVKSHASAEMGGWRHVDRRVAYFVFGLSGIRPARLFRLEGEAAQRSEIRVERLTGKLSEPEGSRLLLSPFVNGRNPAPAA